MRLLEAYDEKTPCATFLTIMEGLEELTVLMQLCAIAL